MQGKIMRKLAAVVLLSMCLVSGAQSQTAQDIRNQLDARDGKSLQSAEAFAKANPKNADAWILLTRARLQAGKSELAVASAETAVKLAPKNAQSQYWLGNAYGSQIGKVGMMSKMSMAPKLREAFEAAVMLDPNNLDARESLVQFYLQAPTIAGGGKDKALAQAAEIAKRDAARGHLAKAQIYLSEKNNSAAVKSYEAAYAANPANNEIRLALGIAYQQSKLWPEAFRHFRAWIKADPKAGSAWYQIGRTSVLSGLQIEEGIAALQLYLKLPHTANEPQNKHAYYRLGQLYAKAGQKNEARVALQTALKLDPDFKDAKEALAKL
jgi:cytochrome c-type biogenesis protein CcmH/NrfG